VSTFVDTSAILAILNAADEEHSRAAAAYRNLLETREPLVSTNYVLVETIALLQRRLGLAAVSSFQSAILPTLDIEWLTEASHQAAVTALLAESRRRARRRIGRRCLRNAMPPKSGGAPRVLGTAARERRRRTVVGSCGAG
jgi:uncharacterized protein